MKRTILALLIVAGSFVLAQAQKTTTPFSLIGIIQDSVGRVHYYSFAGKKEIKKARLTITLAAVNPFSNYIAQTDQKQRPQFISTIDNRYYNRALKLTINRELGGKARKIERKRVDNSDVNVQGKG